MNLEPYLALIESNSRKKSVYEIKLTVEDLQQVDPKRLFHESPAIRRRVPRKRFFLSFFSNPVFLFHIFKKTYIQTYRHISEEFLSLGNDAIPVREGSAEETTKTDLKPATKKEEEEEKSKVQNKKKRETA